MSTQPLFSETPLAPQNGGQSLIIVGLPRSGSSYLAFVLSRIEGWYVFDDLYALQHARGIGADGPLTSEQLESMLHFLGWQLRARIRHVEFAPPQATWEDVDRMDEALRRTFANRPVQWHELVEEWMVRLARHHGCRNWGYKVPQDFFHIKELNKLFPGVRFVFIYRDPRKVMASLKHLHGEDGTAAQYHPYVYASYWRMASETMRRLERELPEQICAVQFEKLVADPNAEAQRIGEFLGARLTGDCRSDKPNSSFKPDRRQGISPTETWICQKVAGEAMEASGYELEPARPRIRDVPNLAWVTLRFGAHQARRLLRSQSGRQSIKTFCAGWWRDRRGARRDATAESQPNNVCG